MAETALGYECTDFTYGYIIADQASRHGDKIFLTYLPDGRTFTYSEIDLLSNRLANGLHRVGIQKGTHVAVLMENSPEQVLSLFALGKLGAVSVPLNTAARGHFLEYFLNQSDSTALIVDAALLANALAVEKRDRVENIIVVGDTAGTETSTRLSSFTEILSHSDDSAPSVDVQFSDMAAIMYTSGTTGPSKGNIFSQIHALTFGLVHIERLGYCRDDVYHVAMPLFHAAAYNSALLPMLLVGGSVALTERLSITRYWNEIRACGATRGMIVAATGFLMTNPPSPDDRNHRLKTIMGGPMLAEADSFERRFGAKLVQGYGITDFGIVMGQTVDDPPAKRFSLGKPGRGVQVRLVDELGREVPTGEVGEMLLRKDDLPFAVSQGYYAMPEATIAATQNLWFHTGDNVRKDEDDYYYFIDRRKDAIRRRGENISSHEVECAILRHPAIADVAAYPIKSSVAEDEVAVSIVVKKGAVVTEVEIIEHARVNMPYFAVPRYVSFCEELPRTLTHKVQKNELKSYVEANMDLIWDRERAGLVITRSGA